MTDNQGYFTQLENKLNKKTTRVFLFLLFLVVIAFWVITRFDFSENIQSTNPQSAQVNDQLARFSLLEPVVITEPENGAKLQGNVKIIGIASTQPLNASLLQEPGSNSNASQWQFDHYQLAYSVGPTFTNWHLIGDLERQEKIEDSLAEWDTTQVPNGEYILRLRLALQSGNHLENQIKVWVDNPHPIEMENEQEPQPVEPTPDLVPQPLDTRLATTAEIPTGKNDDRFSSWAEFLNEAYSLDELEIDQFGAGPYTWNLELIDRVREFTFKSGTLFIVDKPIDTLVQIAKPIAGESFSRNITIQGIASLDSRQYQFGKSVLSYGHGEAPKAWFDISTRTSPTLDARLATWDISEVDNGSYTLRLQVEDQRGEATFEDRILITINKPVNSLAQISSPEDNRQFYYDIPIRGTATLDSRKYKFGRSIVSYGRGEEPTNWIEIGEQTFPTLNNALTTWPIAQVEDGTYTLRLEVEDADGTVSFEDRKVVIIKKPAESVAEITSPTSDNALYQDVTIRGTATLDSRQYQFGRSVVSYGRGEEPTEWVEIGSKPFPTLDDRLATWPISVVDDGPYTLRLEVEDAEGDVVLENRTLVIVKKPIENLAQIANPTSDDVLYQNVTVRGTATLDSRQYQFGRSIVSYGRGEEPTEWVEIGSRPFPTIDNRLATWEITNIENGTYTLRLEVEDANGEVAFENRRRVIVKKPVESLAEISSPEAGEQFYYDITIRGTAKLDSREYQFGRSIVSYGRGEEPTEWVEIGSRSFPTIDNRLATWPIAKVADGLYTLRLQVEDATDGVTFEDRKLVEIKKPAESIAQISSPAADNVLYQDVTIRGTATLDSGVHEFGRSIVSYGRGEEPTEWVEIGSQPFPTLDNRLATWPIAKVADGLYTLRLQVEDATGEVTFEDRKLVEVKKPTQSIAQITTPLPNQQFYRAITIRGTASVDSRVHEFGRSIVSYGRGEEPTEWVEIAVRPVPTLDNRLATWLISDVEDGPYTIRLQVEDATGEVAVEDRKLVVIEKPSQSLAQISSPEAGQQFYHDITIRGTATLDTQHHKFGRSIVSYGRGEAPTEWIEIGSKPFPTLNNRIATWNIASLENGVYTLRLQVEDAKGEMTLEDKKVITIDKPLETVAQLHISCAEAGLQQIVTINGNAALDTQKYQFGHYRLSYGQGSEPREWIDFWERPFPVLDGNLAKWDVSKLENGPHVVRLQVTEAGGDVVLDDQQLVIIDNPEAPTTLMAQLSSPTSFESITGKVAIRGTATVDSRVQAFGYFLLSYGVGTAPTEWIELRRSIFPETEGLLSVWEVRPLQNGPYTLRLQVIDKQGNISAENQIVVQVENPPPSTNTVVQIDSPIADALLNWNTTIRGTATLDNQLYQFGHYRIEYGSGVNPTEWIEIRQEAFPVFADSLGSWDIQNLEDGIYTLRLVAEDNRGTVSFEDRITVNIDKPDELAAQIAAPQPGQIFPGQLPIVGTATVDSRQHEFGCYLLDYGEGAAPREWLPINIGRAPRSKTRLGVWDTTNLARGLYTLRLRVEDVSGDIQVTDQTPLILAFSDVDLVEITEPRSRQTVSDIVSIKGSAVFDISGTEFGRYTLEYDQGSFPFEWVELKVSTQPVIDGELFNWDISQLENDSYTLRLVAENQNGSLRIEDSITVFVNNQ